MTTKQHESKLQNTHAASQNPDKKQEDFQYKCLWTGCKVFGRTSSSKSWLEKHVAGHVDGGQKPFQVHIRLQQIQEHDLINQNENFVHMTWIK